MNYFGLQHIDNLLFITQHIQTITREIRVMDNEFQISVNYFTRFKIHNKTNISKIHDPNSKILLKEHIED